MEKGTVTNKLEPSRFNLREIIQNEWVEAHFQPIVSLKRRCIVGLEGLIRGLYPGSRNLISPIELFRQAALQGLDLELDKLCRKKVMDDFRLIHSHFPDLVLSVNLDASVLEQGAAGSGHLRAQVAEMGLKPENIAIEIIESKIGDLKELQRFVQLYRSYGFLIALDDVGAGHSNLDRIPLIKPDILKIDRFLIQDIHDDFYKQEVLRSLVQMSRRLGTLIIAEGVETQAEAVCLLDMDVDMIQGFYFSKPQRHDQLEYEPVLSRIDGLGGAFKRKFLRKIGAKKHNMNLYYATIMEIQMELSQMAPIHFDSILNRISGEFTNVESLYILDESGTQISESVFNDQGRHKRNPIIFRPSPKGADHTMKDYFYFLMEAGLSKTSYVTEPYLSMASGTSCVTLSSLFKNANGQRYVLCLDINTDSFGEEAEPEATA
jgi:EAL domain-containing protein (putative c-di-GMP-specific phosphodiesterase class I)